MFYDQLKKACTERGTSPCAVALASGMSKSNVTFWKNGQTPKLDTIVKLAKALRMDPRELIPDELIANGEGTSNYA